MTRHRVLFGAFLLVALGGAFLQNLLDPPVTTSFLDPRVSTENTGPRGARALYLWLREFGYSSRSFREPLTALGPGVKVLFLLEPDQAVTGSQAESLFEWVRAGGTLFVAPSPSLELEERLEQWVTLDFEAADAAEVRGDRIVPDDGERWRYRELAPGQRGMFAYPVREVAVRGSGRVGDPTGEHTVLFGAGGHGLLAELFHGDGTIVVFPEADMLTNRGLAKAQNVELVASLIEEIPAGTEIWFDEYHHGARVAGSLLAYFARRRPGLFALALASAGALAVLRWGHRLVTPPEGEGRRRRRPSEFVDALGSLYARSHAVAPAWNALADCAQRLLRGERTAFPSSSLLFSTPAGAARGRRLEQALRRGGSQPGEEDLLRLADALARTLGAPSTGERG